MGDNGGIGNGLQPVRPGAIEKPVNPDSKHPKSSTQSGVTRFPKVGYQPMQGMSGLPQRSQRVMQGHEPEKARNDQGRTANINLSVQDEHAELR
jgi:hypothetical protein